MSSRHSSSLTTGIWKKDSVKDVAESVGISNLPDEVASALAGDVEYRLWEIIEESIKFMRHSRRTRLKVDDVDHALKVRNLEPLWGFASTSHLPFKKTVTSSGTVYHVEDEEIDLTKIVKAEVIPSVPREVSFTAHWLAIEGVQPLIKENPTPAELAKVAPKSSQARNSSILAASSSSSASTSQTTITPLVKHVLSRELQLYFTRLTEALATSATNTAAGVNGVALGAPAVGAGNEMREAALGSVRSDPGLHQLVPYLVGWGGEQIANHLDDLGVLERSLDLFHAMLENPTLFIEPYLHQLTPPILTCLLTSSLPSSSSSSSPTPLTIRTSASSLLHLLLSRHSSSYPSLRPRITKTLLRGLAGVGRGLGARWGAARGLAAVVGGQGGNVAVREWIGGGLKVIGELMEREREEEEGDRKMVVDEVLRVLRASLLPEMENGEKGIEAPPHIQVLHQRYGPLFGDAILEMWETGGNRIFEAELGAAGGEGAGAGVAMERGQDGQEEGTTVDQVMLDS